MLVIQQHAVSVQGRAYVHLIGVAEHLGASSRRPPLPRPSGGVSPGRVPVHTALNRHLEQASRNLLDLPNKDVDHLVDELQMRKLYGQQERARPREPASAPRHGCRRHEGDDGAAQPANRDEKNLVELQLCNPYGQRTMGIGLRTTTGMMTTTSRNCPSGSYRP